MYLATAPKTEAPIIVKVLLPKYLAEKDVAERFLQEAKIISLANHPNIVRLVDSGRWEGGLFIAMEFVKGSSLKKIFQHQPYTLKRAMDVLLQIAYATSHLHSHGIIHGDLKPENILINEQGQVKVIDFGIARLLTDDTKEHPTRFLGTPIYMSPELGLNRHNLSFQSDIYALGIIAYELALGKLCHGRVIISLAPKGLQKLLERALQPLAIDRYKDMCDFIGDLSSYIKSGDLEKDKQGSDQFLEIFEQLESTQNSLLPPAAPNWHGITVEFAREELMGLAGLYVDFIDLSPTKKLIIIAESTRKGPLGLIDICMFKACVKTLVACNAVDKMAATLPDNCLYATLILDTTTKEHSHYHSHYGPLVSTHGKLLMLGTENNNLAEEVAKDPSQKAEAILRKARLQAEALGLPPPLAAILINFHQL